jgi:hypothetical protein
LFPCFPSLPAAFWSGSQRTKIQALVIGGNVLAAKLKAQAAALEAKAAAIKAAL